jgi:hypothetical protein
VFFTVTQKGDGDAEIENIPWNIEGEPLAWQAEGEVRKSIIIDGLDPKKPPEVKQEFSWSTSPIKRLDRIEVGNRLAVCQRMETRGLMAKQIGKAEEGEEARWCAPVEGPMVGGGPPAPGAGGPPPGSSSLASAAKAVTCSAVQP